MLANLKRISIATGLLAASMTLSGQAQAQQQPATSANQATANAVAASLGSSPALQGYRIAIDVRDGMVTLKGAVSNPQEHNEVIERARQAPGVVAVVDYVQVVSDAEVTPVQYQVAHGGLGGHGHAGSAGPMMGGGGGFEGGPISYEGGMMAGDNGMSGPLPEGPAGMGGSQASPPGYPNYAWPSYAPYPNFSAVGYPTAYPWQAWPNIGPIHPYPEVPLDWRAVTLRWKDGIWFLDFKKHYTRPFFTPYPFGLFAY